MKRALLTTLAAAAVLSCGARTGGGGADGATPVIDSVEPTSGRMGQAYPVRITLRGHGFADSTNVVTFGGIEMRNRPSSEGGTVLVFSAPKVRNLGTEAPPPVLQPGEYEITVTTSAGASNVVTFTLTSSQ